VAGKHISAIVRNPSWRMRGYSHAITCKE